MVFSPRRLYHFCLYFEINLFTFLKYALHSILLAYNLLSTTLRLKVDQLTTFASWGVPTVTVSLVWFVSGGKQNQFWLGGIVIGDEYTNELKAVLELFSSIFMLCQYDFRMMYKQWISHLLRSYILSNCMYYGVSVRVKFIDNAINYCR